MTGELVGQAFSQIRDLGDDFNLVFATAAHTSAKMREELQAIDPEQFAKLPAEPVRKTTQPREKAKTKTRKVVDGSDIKDFLHSPVGFEHGADKHLGTASGSPHAPSKVLRLSARMKPVPTLSIPPLMVGWVLSAIGQATSNPRYTMPSNL